MAEWYVRQGGKEHGPMDAARLKSLAQQGRLKPDSHVRKGAQTKWSSASNVKGLFEELQHSVPVVVEAEIVEPPEPPPMAEPAAQPVHVHVTQQTVVAAPQAKWNRLLAMLLSLIIPGLGQCYKGQIINGAVWFFLTIIGYVTFIFPGAILHICCVLGAGMGDPYR